MDKTQNELVDLMKSFIAETQKRPTKAGHARMRKMTLAISKLGKDFRVLSLDADKK